MDLNRIVMPVFGLLFLTFLSACSGDGDTSPPSPVPLTAATAEGFWTGTTNTNRTVTGVVLDDGVYWFLYSVGGDPSIIEGVLQGDSNAQDGALNSLNAKDFNVERPVTPVLNATINGSYTTKQSLSGSYQSNVPDTFTTTYNSDYELTPDITAVTGTYTGPVAQNETVNVTVSAAGGISGISSTGCRITGSVSPRTRGNVFDVTITFGGQSTCSNGTNTVNGVGLYNARTKKLYSAAFNSDRTNGFVFLGTKNP